MNFYLKLQASNPLVCQLLLIKFTQFELISVYAFNLDWYILWQGQNIVVPSRYDKIFVILNWLFFFSPHRLQSHHCIGQNLNETRLTDWRKLYLFVNRISSTLRLYCAIKCLSVKWMPGALNDVGWYFNACCFCLYKIGLNIDFPQILMLFDIFFCA